MHATRSAKATQKRLRGARNDLDGEEAVDTRRGGIRTLLQSKLTHHPDDGAISSRSRAKTRRRPCISRRVRRTITSSATTTIVAPMYGCTVATQVIPAAPTSSAVLRAAFVNGSGVAETATRAEVFAV